MSERRWMRFGLPGWRIELAALLGGSAACEVPAGIADPLGLRLRAWTGGVLARLEATSGLTPWSRTELLAVGALGMARAARERGLVVGRELGQLERLRRAFVGAAPLLRSRPASRWSGADETPLAARARTVAEVELALEGAVAGEPEAAREAITGIAALHEIDLFLERSLAGRIEERATARPGLTPAVNVRRDLAAALIPWALEAR